jgi:uncharacterized protein (TIGR03000 family)
MRLTQAAAAVLGVWFSFGFASAADLGSPVPMPATPSAAKCAECGPACPCKVCGCEKPVAATRAITNARVREPDDEPIQATFAESSVARFTFSAPPDCTVTVDGQEVRMAGGRGESQTPPLLDDRTYRYTVRCCTLDGQCQQKVVNFKRGDSVPVNFARPTRPGGSPGLSTMPATSARSVGGPVSWSSGSYPTANTFTPVRVGIRGGTSSGCSSGG